jgi:ribosomal protein S18 acetylase RimI-like enzyme
VPLSNRLTIRKAVAADEPRLVELSSRMANFDLPPWRTPDEITSADGRAMLEALRSLHSDSEVFIAERNGEVAGCLHMVVAFDFFGRRHAHLSVIATSEAAEGTGVGRALMEFADAWGRARRLPFITLNVFAANRRARRLYERSGYDVELMKYGKRL